MELTHLTSYIPADLVPPGGTAGLLLYLVLFTIIFLENSFPPMIWLPGDSLLFLSGLMAAENILDISWLLCTYMIAAFCGYQVSYILGSRLGLPLISRHFSWIVTDRELKRASEFYCRWGNTAVTVGRFIPVIRTITPFLAGISRMDVRQFTAYNILGALLWPPLVCGTGYLCGVHPWLIQYRDLVIIGVAILFVASILGSLGLMLRTRCQS